jgi:hypothetical protein
VKPATIASMSPAASREVAAVTAWLVEAAARLERLQR